MSARRSALPLLALLLACAQTAWAQSEPLVIGDTFPLESSILGETRRVNVYAPAGYSESDTLRLPVLYMPDGGIGEDFLHVAGLVQIGSLNWTMRPFLLVGIENTQRRRDLTPPTNVASDREIAPIVGGSAAFRSFLRDELMPHVDSAYRTTGETALVGESLAGLFVVETMLVAPELFDTYVAIDPSLWWNAERALATADSLPADHFAKPTTLFLAASAQPEIAFATIRLANQLRADAPANLTVHHRAYPDEQHWTIYHPAALDAFRLVFARKDE